MPPEVVRNADAQKLSGMRRWAHYSKRGIWLFAGAISLVVAFIGIFLPLLPTTPFVLLAAFCFSRGSERWERWLVHHPKLGPPVQNWRRNRAVPLRAKQLATVMMTIGAAWSWWMLPPQWCWVPAACCAVVAAWLWTLPNS